MQNFKDSDQKKLRKDLAKKAINLALQNDWTGAVEANIDIVNKFDDDLEAYNRLGKALTELGKHQKAKDAFRNALKISPYNSIAQKNLDRLNKLGNDISISGNTVLSTPQFLIEESGKSGLTALIDLAKWNVLLKLVPGHRVYLKANEGRLRILDSSETYLGTVEPKLSSRLIRLIDGGNHYEGTVMSVNEKELIVMIREIHQDPSQASITSFPTKVNDQYTGYMPTNSPNRSRQQEQGIDLDTTTESLNVKDWSNDDTEPGDDEVFTPAIHRIMDPSEEDEEDETY